MKPLIASLIFIAIPAISYADIFKCIVDGKSHYQANPCKEEQSETALPIRTVDQAANLRGQTALSEFEMKQAEKRLLEAEINAANARAAANAASAQRQAAAAEARLREAEAYQQQVDINRDRSEAVEKYLYKSGGMSPTFKR